MKCQIVPIEIFFFFKQFSQVGGLVVIIHKRNEPNLAVEARQDGWNFFEILPSSGDLHELIVPKKRKKRLFLTFFFSLKIWPLLCFFFPPRKPLSTIHNGFHFCLHSVKIHPQKKTHLHWRSSIWSTSNVSRVG